MFDTRPEKKNLPSWKNPGRRDTPDAACCRNRQYGLAPTRRTRTAEETTMTGDPPAFALAICGGGRGQIAIAACPGRSRALPLAAADRQLQRDTATIARWGAQVLVTLLDSLELARLRLQALPAELALHRVDWQHLPLDPRQTPNPSFEDSWRKVAAGLAGRVRDGGRVAIHCRDGRTRAGMVAALLLVELGCAPQDAINRVRAARPGAIELPQQEDYIRAQTPASRSADIFQMDLLESVAAGPAQAAPRPHLREQASEPAAARYALQR
jgi:ADP-ribosyl-[dinitrogen reductase] hydrolase